MKSTNFLIPSFLFTALLMSSGCSNGEKGLPSENGVRLINKMYLYESNIKDSQVSPSSHIQRYDVKHWNVEVSYRYDEQNRLTEVIYSTERDSSIVIIRYPDKNTIVVTYSQLSPYTYTLNSDGFVISKSNVFGVKETFMYDDKGYLQKNEFFNQGFSTKKVFITYTWENENIATVVEEETIWTVPSEPVFVYNTITTYEYGAVKYIPCVMDFGSASHLFGNLLPLKYGKPSQNMPSKVTIKSEKGWNYDASYRYETDSEGYPIKIFVQENDEKEALRAVIEYKD